MENCCARCKKEIESGAKLFLGTVYCPECCEVAITISGYSPQSMWCVKEKQVWESTGKYSYDLKRNGNDYYIEVFQMKTEWFRKTRIDIQKLHFHRLFTGSYLNEFSSEDIVINVEDGVPFIFSFGYDGGCDGNGSCIGFRQLSYPQLGGIVAGKNQKIQDLFKGLNAENWKEYLNIAHEERWKFAYSCFVAVVDGPMTRIAVSTQSPVHHIYYAECPTDTYLEWKKSRGELENCLFDFETLQRIATRFLIKKHAPFKARNYMFLVREEPAKGGNVDMVFSTNCSTELCVYDSVSHENASWFVNMIASACK